MERKSTPWSGIRSRRLAGKLARGLSGKAELLHGNRRHSLGCATADAAIGGARRPDLWGRQAPSGPRNRIARRLSSHASGPVRKMTLPPVNSGSPCAHLTLSQHAQQP